MENDLKSINLKKYEKNLMMVKGYKNDWKGVRRPRKNSKDMIL
jgi:hypothetical protein